jgi:chemotaxis methyl-accepting protein methylase
MTALPLARSIPRAPTPSVTERAPGVYFDGVVPFPGAVARARPVPPAPVRPLLPLEQGAEHVFLATLLGRAGLRLDDYRPGALLRRIPACLRRLGVKSLDDATRKLADRPALAGELLDIVLLGVTEFCRDPAVFAYLREYVLPQLGWAPHVPRIWSAACSEGQELYSVAACLAELDLLERCELLGTDCRPEAIARARAGEYASEAAAKPPAAWQRAHLFPAAGRARIHPRLRTAVTWRVADLLTAVESGPWDLIFCRNMAIYLEPDVAAALWRRLASQLAPGGCLVTGKAENPIPSAPLERAGPCLYRLRTPQ